MHPEWYYSDYDRIFGRGNSYTEEIARLASMTSLTSADVQEIGAGTGNHAAILLQYPITSIELVDCDPKAIAILRERFKTEPRVHINSGDGFSHATSHQYNIIYSMYSVALQGIETIADFECRLISMRERLRPGGAFVFEAIDAFVSERIYPEGEESVLSLGDSIHNRIIISSFYNKRTITIRYSGALNGRTIMYSARLLRVNHKLLSTMVGDVFGTEPSLIALDKHGRRLLVKGEVATTLTCR